jgi:hypothetical protein
MNGERGAHFPRHGEDMGMDWALVAEDADAYQDLSRSVDWDSRQDVVLSV